METSESQPSLAADNYFFSLRWLPHSPAPSTDFHAHENHLKTTHNFNFDLSVISSTDDHSTPLTLTQPDKLLFMPSSTNHGSTSNQARAHRKRISVWKFLQKYLGFWFPSCPRVAVGDTRRRRRRKSKKVDDLNRRTKEVKSLTSTPQTVSPRMSTASAYSAPSDYETSIYEAILYCKSSRGQ